jgi:hypothetical protein
MKIVKSRVCSDRSGHILANPIGENQVNNKFLAILLLALVAGSAAAKEVQSTTSAQLTFRNCVKGVTACDYIGKVEQKTFGGLPGDSTAHAKQSDPAFGESSADVKLTGLDGGAEFHGKVRSEPGTRNGSNGLVIMRYTNNSEHAEKYTLNATLSYEQTVPEENAEFPWNSSAQTAASAEMGFVNLDVEALEAGTTAEENAAIMDGEPLPEWNYRPLEEARFSGDELITATGSKEISVSTVIDPGDSIWMFTIFQVFGANGSIIDAGLNTITTITEVKGSE